MKRSPIVVGIDLGGTNMQVGVVNARNKIIGREGKKTKPQEGADAVLDRVARAVNKACEYADLTLKDVSAVGIAAPGAIDIPNGIVLEAPNLKWYDFPLRAALQKKLKCKVVVDNDVNGAVWGEFRLGAARPASGKSPTPGGDVLGAWIGTGVGGGLVLNGRLHYGAFFTAGEIGHTVLFPQGEKGRRTVEDFCSRTGMSRTIQMRLKDYKKSALHEITEGTGKITGSKQLAKAYKQRDPLALDVVHEAAEWLGVSIANWITVLAIDRVVIGGGVTEALGEPYLRRVRASFRKHVFPKRCRDCQIIMTKLKDEAGVLGAALLAREALV